MENLTFKQKMDLYDELIEKRKVLTSRIDTFKHIANSWRWGGRDYSIYYMSKVHDPRYSNGVHKDFKHKLNKHDLKDLYDFAEMRMNKLISEREELNKKINELENN